MAAQLQRPPDQQLTISLKALQRARTTLDDFAHSYLPYLGLHPERDFFCHLDVLVWLEATIYQLDENNEAMCMRRGVSSANTPQKLAEESCIRGALEQLGLWDERVAYELQQADVYWCLERRLTSQMLAQGAARREGDTSCLDLTEVMRAHGAKSFDYRLMFFVLHRLVKAPYDNLLLEFLRVDERLVDIGDDLTDYEDDVEANSFNIFRAYVFLYGRDAQLKLVELISALEGEHSRLLAQLSKEHQEHYWARHKEASHEPGSGRWCFPPPIYDEAAFRSDLASRAQG